jgi:hypothetical protein
MTSIVQVDNKFNMSLKKVKDALDIRPNDTFSRERVNTQTFTLKKIGDADPFIESVRNPAHLRIKRKINLDRLEDEQWSA